MKPDWTADLAARCLVALCSKLNFLDEAEVESVAEVALTVATDLADRVAAASEKPTPHEDAEEATT
jgi:hypothetical protein